MLAVLGVIGIAMAIVVVAGIDDEGDTSGPGRESGAAGAADEVDDVGGCTLVDPERMTLEVTNNSSRQSTYIIDVNFLDDDDGARVGDETFFVNFVRPDERVREEHFVFDSAGGDTCEIAEVQRFAAETADDLAEVTCVITGVDPLGDIATAYTATNGSSELSDYVITSSLVRDGERIGTSHAVIENVRPGQQAPGDGFSIAAGPADGVVCEPVHVQRTSSE